MLERKRIHRVSSCAFLTRVNTTGDSGGIAYIMLGLELTGAWGLEQIRHDMAIVMLDTRTAQMRTRATIASTMGVLPRNEEHSVKQDPTQTTLHEIGSRHWLPLLQYEPPCIVHISQSR